MRLRPFFFGFSILAVLTLLVQGGNKTYGQASSPIYIRGIFNTVWRDAAQGSGETPTVHFLFSTKYGSIQLIIDKDLLTTHGGPLALNYQKVTI